MLKTPLTEEDLFEVTRLKQNKARSLELDHMKIPYKERRDGSLLVLWEDISPSAVGSHMDGKRLKMNLGALHATKKESS